MKLFDQLVRETLSSIYPHIVDKYSRSTVAHMNKIRIGLEPDLDDPNYLFISADSQFDNLIKTVTKHPNERSTYDIHLIANYLKQTELMQKLIKDTSSFSEHSLDVLCNICASQVLVLSLKCGSFAFKMDEAAETFFILVKGSVSVLKPQEKGVVKMTGEEYLEYLQYLEKNNEKYLLNKTLRMNYPIYPIEEISEIESIQQSIFKMRFKNFLLQDKKGPDVIDKLFKRYNLRYEEFNIDENEMKEFWQSKLQQFDGTDDTKQLKASNDFEWICYLKNKIKITLTDEKDFETYSNFFLQHERMEVRIIHYEHFMYVYPGQTFGDIALDTDEKRRTASVRAEEDSLIAILPNEIYAQYIRSVKIKLKAKEIIFLHDSFFFEPMPVQIFEKKFFLAFAPHEYYRGCELIKMGNIPTDLLMIRDGKVEVRLIGSIIDLHNLIKLLIDKLLSNQCYKEKRFNHLISSSEVNAMKMFLKDDELTMLKRKPKSEVDEFYKERKFQLCILSANETIGLEEIFLGNMKCMCNVIAITEKVKLYKLSLEKLKQMCSEDKGTFYSFVKCSTQRVFSLIKRIQQVKRTILDFISMKRREDEQNILKSSEHLHLEKFPTISSKNYSTATTIISKKIENNIQKNLCNALSKENIIMNTTESKKTETDHLNVILQSPDLFKQRKLRYKENPVHSQDNPQLGIIKTFISNFATAQKGSVDDMKMQYSERNNKTSSKYKSNNLNELFVTMKKLASQGKDMQMSFVDLSGCNNNMEISHNNLTGVPCKVEEKSPPKNLKMNTCIVNGRIENSGSSFHKIPFVMKYKIMNQKQLKKVDQASFEKKYSNLQYSIFSEFQYNLNKDKNKFPVTRIKNYYEKIKRQGYSLIHTRKNHKKVNSVY